MKNDGKKLLALSMASVLALVPMISSAEQGNSKKPVKGDVKIENVLEDGFTVGVIQSVDEKEITVNAKGIGMARFYAGSSVKIQDEATDKLLKITDLKPGMVVEIEFDVNAPVGLSEPPYYGSTMEIKVITEDVKAPVEEVEYSSTSGKIVEVKESEVEGRKIISLLVDVNGQDGIGDMWYTLSNRVITLSDGKDVDPLKYDFNTGDLVTVAYRNQPMTLQYPGRIAPELVVVNDLDENEYKNVIVSHFDKNLISEDGKLQLVLDKNTKIESYRTKNILTSEDIKDSYAMVIYGATTRSIPAQTLSSDVVKVIVFEKAFVDKDQIHPIPNPSGNSDVAHSKNAVSKLAKDYGYKTKWDPKEQVVTLTKGEDVLKIFIGKDVVEKNGKMYKTSIVSTIEKNRAFVSSELENLLS